MGVISSSLFHVSHPTQAGSLPEDLVIEEILPKLPVESLIRFKRVSRKWLDIISNDSRLVSAHLRHNSNTTKLSIILSRHSDSLNFRLCLLGLDESKVVESDLSYIARTYSLISIIGSSNGLVCLNHWDFGAGKILCNPATREWRNLPKAPILRSYETGWVSNTFETAFGFGFDEHSKDYKLVSIREVYGVYRNNVETTRVQVYTTSNDTWREVKRISGYRLVNATGGGVLVNGALYWLVSAVDQRRYHVLSFDLRNDELQIMDLPDLSPNHEFRLTKWKDSLALLSYATSWMRTCDVFVMMRRNNEIDARIWAFDFRIHFTCLNYFFGVWRDHFLTVEYCQTYGKQTSLHFLSSKGNSQKKIKKALEPGWTFLNEAHDYVPSLVSVNSNTKIENRTN